MPKWGMTMTEGRVAGWLVREGDTVEPGREVVEIETEKITNVMDTPASGIVRRVVVPEGATAAVGTLLAVIAPPDVPEADIESYIGRYASEISSEAAGNAPTARLVDAGSHAINVLTMGEKEATPLILLHGFAGDLNNWLFNQAELAVDRPVHAIDLPGHGNSSLTEGSGSVPDLAKAVLATMDALGVEKAHLLGHSLGGAVALFMAMKQPQRTSTVTLVCSGGLGPEIDMAFIQGVLDAERRKPMQETLGRLFANATSATRQMADNLLQQKRRDGVPEAWARIAAANFHEGYQAGGMRDALELLPVPVQVIWGREDRIIPVAHAEDLPDRILVRVIESAGHMPHMEEAGTFNTLVRDFLNKAEDA
jgi:pyruvate dehydrogenase E2 component (dihydrolipoamide acetyltransferase)